MVFTLILVFFHVCWGISVGARAIGQKAESVLFSLPPLPPLPNGAERKIDASSPFKPLRGCANIPSKPPLFFPIPPLFPPVFLSYNISAMITFKVKASCWPSPCSCSQSDRKERTWQRRHPSTDTWCRVDGSEIMQSRKLPLNQKKNQSLSVYRPTTTNIEHFRAAYRHWESSFSGSVGPQIQTRLEVNSSEVNL